MPCTANGLYVVQGDMAILLAAMRRGNRWSSHSSQDSNHDVLIQSFNDLKDVLNQLGDLKDLDPNHYFDPFLEVIRDGETTGPVTSLALSSVQKLLSYGLIEPTNKAVPGTLENIADAVTHTKFVSIDENSDGLVLMKIIQVLRTLVLSPVGSLLTNESMCEIILACCRICLEHKLTEHLRSSAEFCLKDLVQHLFVRLPEFSEDSRILGHLKKLKMNKGSVDSSASKQKRKNKSGQQKKFLRQSSYFTEDTFRAKEDTSTTTTADKSTHQPEPTPGNISNSNNNKINHSNNIVDMQGNIHQEYSSPESNLTKSLSSDQPNESSVSVNETHQTDSSSTTDSLVKDESSERLNKVESQESCEIMPSCIINLENCQLESNNILSELKEESSKCEEVVKNEVASVESTTAAKPEGVRFTTELNDAEMESQSRLQPYGLGCIREFFRFLISLCNPMDKQNTDMMIQVGLSLLRVAFEVGADAIGQHQSLLVMVKDELCRNLFSLLHAERISIFALDIQVLFLMFESLRTHLKFQLEFYLTKLMEMIASDSVKITYEQKEIALESVVQLWRIPGLVTELYLNYDCDLYCPNLFEDLTKLLSKSAFPVSGIYNTHLLSLDALLTIIDSIEGHCHSRILSERQSESESALDMSDVALMAACSRSGRQKISKNIPSHEELMAVKRKKKLLTSGTEQFNIKPKKGIQFLQEHHLLSTPLDPQEVVHFLRENPRLDKKMIGDYISNRTNLEVLDAFVKSFDFSDTRIDEALRLYLETFRLPGESPLISLIMEHFADHWHKCNGEPFANADAAFTLAYAVIMLNVDQHNHNVKRQNNPMTAEDFKKNLKKVNGGEDFDQDMLDEIYNAIKNEEIVMPAEQTGLVKENYLWKVLLRRGNSKDGVYLHAQNGLYDHDLFSLIWSPTIAALSYVFDKSNDITIYQKAISGFRKCAMISAHYGMSNDFDNLAISLCKFTNLINSVESPDNLTISFGANRKAQLAAKTLFNLAHRHGDILGEGWKNVLEVILQLYRCKLLPKSLIEAEDFLEQSGKILLMREESPSQKTETGLLSSIYSYIALGAEAGNQKTPSPEEQEYMKMARQCIKECRIELIITESKFLRMESLQELVKSIIAACQGPGSSQYDEDASVFFLELLVKVVIQNRDRANGIWPSVRDHIYSLVMGASACNSHYLMERSVVALLRLAIRLMRREEMSPIVLQSLRMLLLLKAPTLQRVARQTSYGLYELLKTSAANIHTSTDWTIIFTLLECVGAGAPPPRLVGETGQQNCDQGGTKSDGDLGSGNEDSGYGNDRGYTSDSEVQVRQKSAQLPSPEAPGNTGGGWILVGKEGDIQPLPQRDNQANVNFEQELLFHDPFALVKCCESLAFIVRDVAHITPFNFEYCVHCIRTFVEASLNGTEKKQNKKSNTTKDSRQRKKWNRKKEDRTKSPQLSPNNNAYDADESDSEEYPGGYHQICIQLLDLMHTLHTRTAQIFRWWAEENGDTNFTSLWTQGWCPLLQGIARLCCDSRKQVRMAAITYLQRALLVHDLQTLTAEEWESCFNRVLFPLLGKLLEPKFLDEVNLEETRVRAATVLSKVFLHHLTPLLSLPSFTSLWLNILDFMDKYMHVERSDLLFEAIPESLKNMLLVMHSAQVFTSSEGYLPLWHVTWERINKFLPGLKEEFFKAQSSVPKPEKVIPAVPQSPEVQSVPEPGANPIIPPYSPPRGTSIILQPPSSTYSHTYTTPIFNHLGQQMMTTSISGQPQTISLVPTNSQSAEEKPNFVSLVPAVQEVEDANPKAEEPVGKSEGEQPTRPVAAPVPIPGEAAKTREFPQITPALPGFGSRSSAFVPYVNLNNYHQMHPEAVYIPPANTITAPVQMFSTPALDNDPNKSVNNNNYEPSPQDGNSGSILSQYFSQQNQRHEAFDKMMANVCDPKQDQTS
ncbi:UNVERIFIED_CONTAM: hypothetical protein PYX00_002898 [Menopon gallinae]|uniref:SEC7 domain-containing protein n=1 Tax=Menopon gallinae TaxID=328185 RepID=A0AAW2HYL2_9NEOP